MPTTPTRVLALATALAATISAAVPASAETFVLVHGAFEDAAVWDGVIDRLEALGQEALAVNLPGRAGDPRPADEMTLDLYRDAVLAAIEGEAEPVLLVGHSFGGMTVSAVAEAAPERIGKAIYVAAYLPRSGDSLLSLAQTDAQGQLGSHLVIDQATGLATIAEEARVDLFCHDCPQEVQSGFAATMVPEPLQPQGQPITLGPSFASVAKAYVHTALDRVVGPELQGRMVETAGVTDTITLQTGHAPFLADPEGLAQALVDLAGR